MIEVSPDRTILQVDDAHFHALWLRDACVCATCRRPSTNERLLDSTTLPLDLTIASVDTTVAEHELALVFSDGHETTLALDFLERHTVAAHDWSDDPMGGRNQAAELAIFPRATLDSTAEHLRWLDTISTHGIAIVRNVEPAEEGLLATADLIGHVLPSNYGSTWNIEATVTPSSNVNSEVGLQVHTDLPYRQTPPGLQLILAAVTDVAGGASTFVDGYAMAEQIRHSQPDAWRLLTTIEFTYPYERPGVHLHGAAPLITLRPNGQYEHVRRAPDLVGVPIVAADQTVELYDALRLWTATLDDPANQLTHRLDAGELVAFDNHRMLHGRTPFELGAAGRRHLVGCYLDIDELTNRRSVLRAAAG